MTADPLSRLGNRLRAARIAAGITQRGIARALGIARSDVSRYERGVHFPSVHRLREFCLAYGVSADSMLSLKECCNPDCRRTCETDQARNHCRGA